jgi:dimethylargininase
MVNGISTAGLGKPDFDKAMIQHADYIEALKECGLEVTIMEADEDYPDSCFTEDAALLTPQVAILSNPGAPSRNGEKESMLPQI